MPRHGFFRDLGQADALDHRGGSEEEFLDEFRRQADRIENLRAAIGLIGRNAHLRHDLEHALADRLDEAIDHFAGIDLLREQALGVHVGKRVEGEIGVDRLRAIARKTAEMMDFARLARFDHEADRGAKTLADQVVMHGGGRQQRRDRDPVRADLAVRQHDDVVTAAHGGFRPLAQPVDHRRHAFRALFDAIGDVERLGVEPVLGVANRADLFEIAIGQDRLAHLKTLFAGSPLVIENIRTRADERDQAHHQFLADRIDRRVGDLGEVLLEIGVEQLRLVRHRRDRRIGAHRADRFLTGGRHRRHQDLGIFLGVAEGLLAVEQRHVAAQCTGLYRVQVFQNELGAAEPVLIGMHAGKFRLDLLIGDDPALVHVDQQHLARLETPLGDDVFLFHRQHAGFGRHDDPVILGDQVARRAQTIAVQRRADLAAIGEGDGGGAVPRLHQRGMIFVERLALRAHRQVAGPGFRDQHHHGMRHGIAALHQEFERVVETGGVGLSFV